MTKELLPLCLCLLVLFVVSVTTLPLPAYTSDANNMNQAVAGTNMNKYDTFETRDNYRQPPFPAYDNDRSDAENDYGLPRPQPRFSVYGDDIDKLEAGNHYSPPPQRRFPAYEYDKFYQGNQYRQRPQQSRVSDYGDDKLSRGDQYRQLTESQPHGPDTLVEKAEPAYGNNPPQQQLQGAGTIGNEGEQVSNNNPPQQQLQGPATIGNEADPLSNNNPPQLQLQGAGTISNEADPVSNNNPPQQQQQGAGTIGNEADPLSNNNPPQQQLQGAGTIGDKEEPMSANKPPQQQGAGNENENLERGNDYFSQSDIANKQPISELSIAADAEEEEDEVKEADDEEESLYGTEYDENNKDYGDITIAEAHAVAPPDGGKVVADEASERSIAGHVSSGRADAAHGNYGDEDEDESTHFMRYFVMTALVAVLGYVAFHNKQRIIAIIVEGRRPGGGAARRPRKAAYARLDTNVEEAMPSMRTTVNSSSFIY
ncbi:PREDICTED: trans-Golgi network integral membrane protein 2-like isoform X14 [Priapulus caudatus]|uniref:Trans-Golgi network integral membrane protein 2-like isoform X14 n=1 Tax=Priapulus caudatus TaxID=37621 RepID=A0ABM1E6I6_PRICU|nr:PREDICTED: trans-Golgi network integral membrane protein 2-like isoform X14 [Priapulus caudatus]